MTFKLTEETLDGPPVVGCEVQIGSGSNGFNKPDSIRRLSDSSGVADCGVIRPGDWGFRIRRPWDEGERSWQTIGTINVLPGSKVARSIICPKVPPDFVSLRVKVDWPADLAGNDLCVYTKMQHGGISYQPPSRWMLASVSGGGGFSFKRILSGPGTRHTEVKERSLQFWKASGQATVGDARDPRGRMPP